MLTGRVTGRWWLPETPERTLTGTLVLDWDGRPRLEMIGLLDGSNSPEIMGSLLGMPHVHPTIFGLTTENRAVTIRDARRHVREMHLSDPDSAYVELIGSDVLLGQHSLSRDDGYDRLTLRLTRLLDWIEPPRLATRREHDGRRFVKVEQGWSPWPAQELQLRDGMMRFRVTASESGDGVRERSLHQDASVSVLSGRPLTAVGWYERWVKPMRDLIAFSTAQPCDIEYVGLHPTGTDDDEVEWLWKRTGPGSQGDRTLLPNEMLLSLLDAGDLAADVIERWMILAREDQDALNSFLGPRYTKGMYEENRILNMVQALEALHRRERGVRRILPTDEQVRVDRVLASCPETDRKWLAAQLDFATNIRLRDRLKALQREHAWLAHDVLSRSFVNKVVLARNLYTHLDQTTTRGAPKGAALWPYNEGLVVLLEAMILERLGFDEGRRKELIQRGSRSYQALKLNPGLMSSRRRQAAAGQN